MVLRQPAGSPADRNRPATQRVAGDGERAVVGESADATGAERLDGRIRRLTLLARASLAWERLVPVLAPPAGVLLVFAATALLGVWTDLGTVARIGLLSLFAIAFVASLWRLPRLRWPTRAEAIQRLERDSGIAHRPLTTWQDRLADVDSSTATRALWSHHRRRAAAALDRLSPRLPDSKPQRHDPFGLRAGVAMLAIVAVAVAGGAWLDRLASPFRFASPVEAGPAFRMDAWVTPPAYTGRPPLFLSAANRTETLDGIAVPEGSVFELRVQGNRSVEVVAIRDAELRTVDLSTASEGEPVAGDILASGEAAPPHAARGARIDIDGHTLVEVRAGDETLDAWQFVAEPDAPPTIAIIDRPAADARGGFEIRYEAADDYGVVRVTGALDRVEGTRAAAPPASLTGSIPARPLYEAPELTLSVPPGPKGSGATRAVQDLASHPWAGAEVALVLTAEDAAEQTGTSDPVTFTLPSRPFYQNLARAIIEQRRWLAMDANMHPVVIDALDALTLVPEGVFQTAGEFLATRQLYADLVAADTDDELREMVDRMWELAVMIEDGALSDAERALQAAQDALRRALQEGASDEEIERLTQNLREALNRYLQALAEQAQQNADRMPMDPNAQTMTSQDLEEMLRQIEELAKSGARSEAEQLLSQMEQMLRNLQAGRPQMSPNGAMGEAGQMLDQLGRMIQRQQELMDQTHDLQRRMQEGEGRQGQRGQQGQQGQGQQGQQGQGQQGGGEMSPEQLAEALRRLQEGQGDLQRQLQELMDQLADQGLEPGEQLGQAGESMGDAEQQLGQSRPGDAVGDQGRAIDQLRQGAQNLAQQMQGQGDAPGEQMGQNAPGQDRDPLGRFRRNQGSDLTSRVQIPDEIDVQRARRILEELRERLGDIERPRFELEYLERLLPSN